MVRRQAACIATPVRVSRSAHAAHEWLLALRSSNDADDLTMDLKMPTYLRVNGTELVLQQDGFKLIGPYDYCTVFARYVMPGIESTLTYPGASSYTPIETPANKSAEQKTLILNANQNRLDCRGHTTELMRPGGFLEYWPAGKAFTLELNKPVLVVPAPEKNPGMAAWITLLHESHESVDFPYEIELKLEGNYLWMKISEKIFADKIYCGFYLNGDYFGHIDNGGVSYWYGHGVSTGFRHLGRGSVKKGDLLEARKGGEGGPAVYAHVF
ncbi:hypothetical protein GT347_02885 [Xylophilus rhododendri]|uniref:Uncharacterized protein n=1 Tax=Xylophilus rhododendri TaxID=2697032 RepID=A0A857IZI9_9BURK|nr:hypothetical protein [Xylophilus rhododendri]QHI97020.1 hypothetical protein GT347_02885 [Xylophilus rhododendri]